MDREKRKEQWSDLCRGTRKLAGDLGQAAWEGAWKAGQAAGSAVRCARTGLRALKLRARVSAQMRAVGKMVYATHSGNPTPSDTLNEALEAADKLSEEIEDCQRALAALRGVQLCGVCGAENSAGDAFCTHCGQPLDC